MKKSSKGNALAMPGTREKPLFVIEDRGYKSCCWVWKRSLSDGYAVMSFNGKMRHGHKVVYSCTYGEVPNGYQLDHLCRVRSCIRPDHLETVTQIVNLRRGAGTKFTQELVDDLRSQYVPRSLTHGGYALARKYGIKQDTIGKIMRGARWK